MSSTERLEIAIIAAAVGAVVGASTTAARGVERPPSARSGDGTDAVDHREVQPAIAAADDPAVLNQRNSPVRQRDHQVQAPAAGSWVRHAANAVSLMALGALVTLAVLWGVGTFAPSGVQQTAATGSTTGAPLPRTAADLAAAIAASEAAAAPVSTEDPTDAPRAAAAPRADPAIIEIPVIDVQARVVPLGLEPSGELEVPEDFSETGWWTGGPTPGDTGPSVIVGHVDSYLGPAVFFDLRELVYDDLIRVTRADGSAATFAVRSMVAVEKDEFPTDLVYGHTSDAQLRLITCDGDFAEGSYLGNLIVTADLIIEHAPPTVGLIS